LKKVGINSARLHILAMIFMFIDHFWRIIPGQNWMNCVGRLAFPIFAFLLVEGFFHTHNRRVYALRLLSGAIVSEIPFNLMFGGFFLWEYQNIMWTLFIGFLLMWTLEWVKDLGLHPTIPYFTSAAVVVVGFAAGCLFHVDYEGVGILTVLAFYFCRGNSFCNRLGQLAWMVVLHGILGKGHIWAFSVLGLSLSFPVQTLAIFSLPIIWKYNGKQGCHSKGFQYFCYAFYPTHLLCLSILRG